jgi:rhodanese-related sulfurtransferase
MQRINPQELQREREAGGVLILDVRSSSAFEQATEHIPGDMRRDPDQLEQWYRELPREQHVVAYCT